MIATVYRDLPFDLPSSPVYATPDGKNDQMRSSLDMVENLVQAKRKLEAAEEKVKCFDQMTEELKQTKALLENAKTVAIAEYRKSPEFQGWMKEMIRITDTVSALQQTLQTPNTNSSQ
jgi:hypothetical protein